MFEADEDDVKQLVVDDHFVGQQRWTQKLDTDVDDTVGHPRPIEDIYQRQSYLAVVPNESQCK